MAQTEEDRYNTTLMWFWLKSQDEKFIASTPDNFPDCAADYVFADRDDLCPNGNVRIKKGQYLGRWVSNPYDLGY